MIQHVSSDCFKKGVRVNCVAPGPIDTTFLQGLTNTDIHKSLRYLTMLFSFSTCNSLGHPEEIAATVAYLLSDDSSYVTGNCIIASGGLTLHRSL
ncbi:Tropinone reductase-like 3 [Holothuria leucospilota]|uniref:Tropinone reductase-like 3 n=1 Tax=Holothuria leucospilota TaxID=206669 RepID=A0A9Q1BPF9_HOLLE|nr:Tropinone reductase-like 3 [Holothuria leucospilota]